MIVYICVPNVCIKQVKLCPTLPISSLNKLFPNHEKNFLYKGLLLRKEKSFQHYSIGEGDNIVATDRSQGEGTWRMNSQFESYTDKIQIAFDENMKIESAKIRDIQLLRIESKSKAYRKFASTYQNRDNHHNPVSKFSFSTYDQPEAPSNTPLPNFWSSSPSSSSAAHIPRIPLSPIDENDIDMSRRV